MADSKGEPDRFPCPNCPEDGSPYQVAVHRTHIVTYLRCPACDHQWTVERKSGDLKFPL